MKRLPSFAGGGVSPADASHLKEYSTAVKLMGWHSLCRKCHCVCVYKTEIIMFNYYVNV